MKTIMKRVLLLGLVLVSIHLGVNAAKEDSLVTDATKDAAFLAPTSRITNKKWTLKGQKYLSAREKSSSQESLKSDLLLGGLLGGFEGAALMAMASALSSQEADEQLIFNTNGTYTDNLTLKVKDAGIFLLKITGTWSRKGNNMIMRPNVNTITVNCVSSDGTPYANLSQRRKYEMSQIAQEMKAKSKRWEDFEAKKYYINRVDTSYFILDNHVYCSVNELKRLEKEKVEAEARERLEAKKAEEAAAAEEEEDRIFDRVEENAQFPGGDEACFEWLCEHIVYPSVCQEHGVQGRVIVSFVINTDGSLVDVKTLRSPDSNLSKEAERVVKMMPKWKPARLGNKTVRSRFNLPVLFRLN